MPAKKQSSGKKAARPAADKQRPTRTTATGGGEPPYSCDNPPPKPLSLYEIQWKIMDEPEFATFFAEQLCTASMSGKGSRQAKRCVEKWFKPTPDDLYTVCVPESRHARLSRCTDQALLISPVAYYFAKLHKR